MVYLHKFVTRIAHYACTLPILHNLAMEATPDVTYSKILHSVVQSEKGNKYRVQYLSLCFQRISWKSENQQGSFRQREPSCVHRHSTTTSTQPWCSLPRRGVKRSYQAGRHPYFKWKHCLVAVLNSKKGAIQNKYKPICNIMGSIQASSSEPMRLSLIMRNAHLSSYITPICGF